MLCETMSGMPSDVHQELGDADSFKFLRSEHRAENRQNPKIFTSPQPVWIDRYIAINRCIRLRSHNRNKLLSLHKRGINGDISRRERA